MELREKIDKIIFNVITLIAISLLSIFAPVMYYSFRFGWVFVDVALFNGFCMTLFWLMIANAILGIFIDLCAIYDIKINETVLRETKWFFILQIIHIVLTCIFTIISIVFMAVSGGESIPVGFKFLAQALPIFAGVYGALVLMLYFPKITNIKAKMILAGIIAFLMILMIILCVFPCFPYRLTSHPIVIDNGENYSVVFATNDIGTGYIEYSYNGKNYKVYDENNGRLNGDSKIHTISVPYEHLEGNTYRIGSKMVIDELSYGGRMGAEKISEEYKFSSMKGNAEQNYLMISDWHTHLSKAKKAIENVGEYGGVIMLGDSSPGINFEEEVIRNIIEFGGEITKGSMPIIFARGNHETRGRYAGKLADDLGMDKFYFTVDTGDYTFLILDSGEDKTDNHPEYGGMVNYEQYREDMVKWLEKEVSYNGDNIITFVHSRTIAIEEDLSNRAYKCLQNLGVKYVFSGHTHECGIADSIIEGIINFEDGGYKNNRYIASKITLNGNKVDIRSWDNKGNLVFDNNHQK